MGDSSASYIHLVQHLIEECLIFNMSKEESMEALSKHANILPVITSTVWKELEKENKEFFEAYKKKREDMDRSSGSAAAAAAAAAAINDEFQTRQKFHQILLDSDAGPGGSTH